MITFTKLMRVFGEVTRSGARVARFRGCGVGLTVAEGEGAAVGGAGDGWGAGDCDGMAAGDPETIGAGVGSAASAMAVAQAPCPKLHSAVEAKRTAAPPNTEISPTQTSTTAVRAEARDA